jgi:hypothetical protein
MKRFWLWLTIFSWRRLHPGPTVKIPDGIPGLRSVEAQCSGYEPRKYKFGDWQECETDGHYLCLECCHKAPTATEPPATDLTGPGVGYIEGHFTGANWRLN